MPRYRELTRSEEAQEDATAMAEKIATLHAELVRRKVPDQVINSVIDKMAGAASSNTNGWCSPIPALGEQVSNPPR